MPMTPLQIQMMLHYYALVGPYAGDDYRHANSPAVLSQRTELMVLGLLDTDGSRPSGYCVTDRGRAYVLALCDMPLPVKTWVMPSALTSALPQ
jgi:hypothetical protein